MTFETLDYDVVSCPLRSLAIMLDFVSALILCTVVNYVWCTAARQSGTPDKLLDTKSVCMKSFKYAHIHMPVGHSDAVAD